MGKYESTKENKKQMKKYVSLGMASALVLLLAVMPMLTAGRKASNGVKASILSATVENKDIDTQIIGGGQLSGEAALNVRIPENVKLTQYLVGNGDTVKEGDAIAKVDKISVMTAITEVQETLDYLAEEIADAGNDTASTSVKALAGGTVKVIYAGEGESVQDVMLEHGALAILSLDDTMAVKIEKETTLDVGDTVIVTLADGTEADGRVKTNLNGVLTITMDDDDYSVGAKATVSTEAGEELGSGDLYIFSPWSATAYSGTVADILVEENDTVYIGRSMFSLEDTGNTAQFQRLIDQRQKYEELMQELFTMYRTETITAPCDGIITGVDENGAYLLSENNSGWFVDLLSFFGTEEQSGFIAYAAMVVDVTDNGMTLLRASESTCIEELSEVSTVAADISDMTEVWNYSGNTTIYTQNEEGLLQQSGNARVGDLLLAVGDEEQVHWFVVLNGSKNSGKAVQTQNTHNGMFVSLLSDTNTYEEGNTEFTAKSLVDNSQETDNGDENEIDNNDGETGGDGGEPGADNNATVSIITSALNQGVVGQPYTSPLQASDGTTVLAGTWASSGLPADLTIDGNTGVISGTPMTAGTYCVTVSFTCNETIVTKELTLTIAEASSQAETYLGYVAQVIEIGNGVMKAKQTPYTYTITDLDNLPVVSIDTNALTQEVIYSSSLITETAAAVNDYLLIVVGQDGTLKHFVKQEAPSAGTFGEGIGGMPTDGNKPSGSSMSVGGGVGMGQVQTFDPYSLEKLTVASVTSQEHMTVSITIDELDITKIYVGQPAMVSVDALCGEQFEAEITNISNSGENEGGNSKFTVEVTLSKSGEMLPGMYSSAFVTLESHENVPCVPVAALDKVGVDSVLYTSYDAANGTLGDPVVVTIGVSDGENVQIMDGLAYGEVCYYEYYDTYIGSDEPQQQGGTFNIGKMIGGR